MARGKVCVRGTGALMMRKEGEAKSQRERVSVRR